MDLQSIPFDRSGIPPSVGQSSDQGPSRLNLVGGTPRSSDDDLRSSFNGYGRDEPLTTVVDEHEELPAP